MTSRGRSIQWRIMAWLLPVLALVFAGAMLWLSTVPGEALHANNLETVRRASRAILRSPEMTMPTTPQGHPWDGLWDDGQALEGTWIRILGATGRIEGSTRPTEVGSTPPLEDPSCAACHAGDRDPVPDTAIVRGPGGDRFQVLATPLSNRDDCQACHEAQESNLGILVVGQSLEPIRRILRTIRAGVAVAGGLALLLTLLTTRMVLGRLLHRPLQRLVHGAESIGAGRLDEPIRLGEKTELTVLADALNLSTQRLSGMIHRVERQRDEFQTLYHFTDQISRTVRPEERRLRAVELANQFLGAECVLVQADYQAESQTGQGTITLREGDGFEDHSFRLAPDAQEGIPPLLGRIIERWLKGEFDDTTRVKEGWVVGYPVQIEGEHLGLLLLPVDQFQETGQEPPDPDLVRAMCRHIAIALEFSRMQTELVGQERLAAIGETIAGLAHCLKNALNALRAGLFVTDRALEQDDPKKLRRGWDITKVGIRQIEGLSLDMLYYVRERKPKRTETNPNLVAREVIDLLQEMASQKGVELRAELDEQVGNELLDRTTIYRALLNLVTNAIDACTESETGDLVVVRTASRPNEIVLTVEDNGLGMTDDVRARLFTRFFTTKAGKGTGLGLAVVKKIVEEHGGTVDVESTSGRGSSFHLRLPRPARVLS